MNNTQVASVFNRYPNVLLTYVIAGFPSKKETIELIIKLYKYGVHIIELGIPNSIPIYNSKSLHNADILALKNNITIDDCFDIVYQCRLSGVDIPILLLGHYNKFSGYGLDNLVSKSKIYSVNGFIVADSCFTKDSIFYLKCKLTNLSYIPLISNNLDVKELKYMNTCISSYIHFMDYTYPLSKNITELIKHTKKVISKPIVIGVKQLNETLFSKIWSFSNGILIGIALVSLIKHSKLLKTFIERLLENKMSPQLNCIVDLEKINSFSVLDNIQRDIMLNIYDRLYTGNNIYEENESIIDYIESINNNAVSYTHLTLPTTPYV